MGYILAKVPEHKFRLAHWILSGVVMFILGIIIHFSGIPFNKNLYSLSYVLLMAGSACLVFSACYAAIDIPKTNIQRKIMLPLIVLGMNSIAVYAFDHFFYCIFAVAYVHWEKPDQNVIMWANKNVYQGLFTQNVAVIMWSLTNSLINIIFAAILYWRGIFFKV